MEPVKVSRADLRYTPNVKELKDVVCWPINVGPEEKEIQIKILTHYIETTDTRGGKGDTDGGDI